MLATWDNEYLRIKCRDEQNRLRNIGICLNTAWNIDGGWCDQDCWFVSCDFYSLQPALLY